VVPKTKATAEKRCRGCARKAAGFGHEQKKPRSSKPTTPYLLNPGDLNPADLDIERLKRLKVPHDCKMPLSNDLMRAAVNSRTLFPDLDSLAKGLWELEVIRGLG
jgi:hypothetical protein